MAHPLQRDCRASAPCSVAASHLAQNESSWLPVPLHLPILHVPTSVDPSKRLLHTIFQASRLLSCRPHHNKASGAFLLATQPSRIVPTYVSSTRSTNMHTAFAANFFFASARLWRRSLQSKHCTTCPKHFWTVSFVTPAPRLIWQQIKMQDEIYILFHQINRFTSAWRLLLRQSLDILAVHTL